MLTNDQLTERAGFYLRTKMEGAFSHLADMEFAHICVEQEEALLARLREAERLLILAKQRMDYDNPETLNEVNKITSDIHQHWERVNAAQPQKEQA